MRANYRSNYSRIVNNCIIIHAIYMFSRQYRVIINYNVSSNKYNVYHNANKTLNLRLGKHSYIRCADTYTHKAVIITTRCKQAHNNVEINSSKQLCM